MKYAIKITYPSGVVAYMVHRDKTSWCLRSAKKHMSEFVMWSGLKVELEQT